MKFAKIYIEFLIFNTKKDSSRKKELEKFRNSNQYITRYATTIYREQQYLQRK